MSRGQWQLAVFLGLYLLEYTYNGYTTEPVACETPDDGGSAHKR